MKKGLEVILKEARLKVTKNRLLILGVFSEDCKPLSADDIFRKLHSHHINLVTVYRTLLSFERAKIITKVDLSRESVYYELASHHHHHIVCIDCGVIESFDGCGLEGLAKKTLHTSVKFDTIDKHSLEFFGVCKKCAKC